MSWIELKYKLTEGSSGSSSNSDAGSGDCRRRLGNIYDWNNNNDSGTGDKILLIEEIEITKTEVIVICSD
uniref:Uncharacterized protein n=1 Tax=Setaria digitata TaxID=48799 RepID=A0A915Q0M4_9BILA